VIRAHKLTARPLTARKLIAYKLGQGPVSGFDPIKLFSAGEDGTWLDFTTTQVYADTAGTDPAEVGEGIALTLDKSQGGELGAELVTNGDFSDGATGWTVDSPITLTVTDGQAIIERNLGNITDFPRQPIITAGMWYQVDFTVLAASHNVQIYAQGTTGASTFLVSTTGTFSAKVLAGSADSLGLRIGPTGNASATCTIDNISVRELKGVHALQATSTARPIFRLTSGVYYAEFDLTDDILPITLPTITGGTVALVGTSGIWIEDDWDFTAGTLNIGPTTIAGLPAGILSVVGDLCAVIINDRAWSAAERAGVIAWGKARAGDVPVYSQVATFNWDSGTTDPAATYDKALPVPVQQQIYDQIRGCTLNTDGTVNYYLKATDWSKKADDTASDLTGADGNVMVEIPKFYYRTRFTGTQTTWEISPVPLTGFQVHPAFILDGVEVSKRYYGAYDACVYDDSASAYISGLNLDNNAANIDTAADKLASVKGVYPMVGVTRPECRLLAANNGTGWRQLDFYLWSAVGMLYVIEYQTFYNQAELGIGNTNGSYLTSSAVQAESPHTIAGYRDDVGNGSTTSANGQGTATKPGTVAMKYRGIENLFGNCWNWVDAINISVGATGNVHLATDNNRANYADDTTTNYTLVTSSLTTGSNNIQAFLPLGPYFLASAVGGTTAQYVTDRYFGSASANRVALVGGSAADGGGAGVFALSDNTGGGGLRFRFFGARLAR
jgi:hypothetical protein